MEENEEYTELALFTAYALIIIGAAGVVLNSFLLVFLLHGLCKRAIVAQKIVYINLAVSNLAFSLVACLIRGPGLFMQRMFDNKGFCVVTTYLVSYFSKVDLLVIIPITLSILIVTVKGFEYCTNWFMLKLCTISWLIPAIFLAAFAIKGRVTPDSFYIQYSNKSRRCDFTGTAHPSYRTSQSVLFFYLPTVLCALMYVMIGFFHTKYRVPGVRRLARRGCFVTFFYCASWLPFMVVSSYYRGQVSSSVFVLTYLFYYFSVVVNPLTYTLTSQFFLTRARTLYSGYTSSAASPPPNAVKQEVVINVGHSDIDTADEFESGDDMVSQAPLSADYNP